MKQIKYNRINEGHKGYHNTFFYSIAKETDTFLLLLYSDNQGKNQCQGYIRKIINSINSMLFIKNMLNCA